jgi:hypothetical protein
MSFLLLFLLGALGAYLKQPKRVIRYQPLEVPFERRRPSPWIAPPVAPVAQRAVSPAPSMVLPSVARAPQPPPASAPAVLQPIAAKPQRAKAPVVVTVSTRIRLDALAALRRLGFSQKDAQAQLDTSLGLAIQQSLQKS